MTDHRKYIKQNNKFYRLSETGFYREDKVQVIRHELPGNNAYLWVVIWNMLQLVDYGLT